MNISRVLITGSNGFLGRQLVSLFQSDPTFNICATSRSENRNPFLPAAQFKQVDITDYTLFGEVIAAFKPDFIINTAADSSVDSCQAAPQESFALNADSVRHMAEICAEQNIFLIQLSTDFVFDGRNGPYEETAPTNPINAYGLSKVAAERFILDSGCKAAILRTILVYGTQTDPNRSNLILWVKNSLTQQKRIQVVDNQWRMPTFVEDLAKACLLVIQKQATGIFHISSDKMYSIYEIACEVANFWNLDQRLIAPINAESLAAAELRPQKTGFIIEKAATILGFQPHSLVESFQIMDKYR